MKSFQAHSDLIHRIKQWPNSSLVITGSKDFTAKVWDTTNNVWNLVSTYTGHTKWVVAFEYLNESTVASSSNDKTIQIWTLCTGVNVRKINAVYEIWSLKLLPNGIHLCAGQAANGNGLAHIDIYDITTGNLVTSLIGHTGYVNELILINEQNLLVSSSGDMTIRIWNLTTYTNVSILYGHSGWIYGLKMVSSNVLASASSDYKIKVWNIFNGTLLRTLNHLNQVRMSIDLLTDYKNNNLLVSGSVDQTIKVWNWETGVCMSTLNTNLQIGSLATVLISTGGGACK